MSFGDDRVSCLRATPPETIACLALFSLIPALALAQGRAVQGTVVDSTGAPISYANVIATGSGRRVVASPDGHFRLPLDSSAKRVIEIRRIGFQPLTLNLDPWPDSAIRVVLSAATRTLSSVTISATRSRALAVHGFYERMADVERGINHGFFITPEEIESRPGARATDFLQGRTGVRVQLVKDCPPWEDCRQGMQPQGINGCRLEIYVDGARFYSLQGTKGVGHINDLLSPSSIAAIEVYPRSVTAPPKYQSLNGTCGVMLIWTK